MSEDRPDRPGGPTEDTDLSRREVADVLDDVAWTFDPEAEDPSTQVSTDRYFRDFPWTGDEDDD